MDGRHLLLVTIDEQARPLSIRVLGAYAEALGVRTTLLVVIKPLGGFGSPMQWSASEVRQIAAFLRREHVTHLGFYLMTASLKPYGLLVRALRQAGYRGLIIAGGVHPTLCPEESLVEGADYAVQGPGELPLDLLLRGAPPETIPGLVWRRSGQVAANPQTPAQKMDLDALPFPLLRFDRDLMLVNGKLRPLTWRLHERYAGWHGRYYDLMTSRGCVYRCAYCCNVYGAPVRRASVDHMIRELKRLREVDPRITGVNIQDDSFYAGSDDWVREFCARMKAEVGLPFIARMIPRYVTPERIDLFKSSGLEYVTMGLESSDRMNREVFNRKEDSRSFLKAAQTVLDAGLLLSVDLIINNPFERESDLKEVALTLNALPRPNWGIVALSLTPFPGTPLYRRCVKERLLERFATDAYDAMLNPTRPGGYHTPRFWLLLNTVVLPRVSPEVGARLIELGPTDARATSVVERLWRSIETTRRVTNWLRDETPGLYGLTYRFLRLFARGRSLPSGMKVVE